MDTFVKKIKNASYGKVLKWWLILGICVGLLGGGLSAVLLRPQIQEGIAAVQTQERLPEGKHGEHDWEKLAISEPSTAAKVTVGITLAAAALFAGFYWLALAGFVWQQACRAEMNGLLWGLLALAGNLFAAVLFFLVRSVLRQRCVSCGSWQRKGSFCRSCGAKLTLCCPACGGKCGPLDRYCSGCGAALKAEQA